MLDSGFIKIPRSLFNDPIWKSLPLTYKHVYLTILSNVVFKKTTQDDFGVIVHLNPGQFLTTHRELVDLCADKKINKSLVTRALAFFQKFQFSNQTSNHIKTIITITRKDIMELIEPSFDTPANQTRTIKEDSVMSMSMSCLRARDEKIFFKHKTKNIISKTYGEICDELKLLGFSIDEINDALKCAEENDSFVTHIINYLKKIITNKKKEKEKKNVEFNRDKTSFAQGKTHSKEGYYINGKRIP